ncbi:hypothetical protein K402DRAFT_425344 [Aulographum hederae CBS 113979]|uniref:Uncharacterized protein n=1 Tax=Aulographum hederae CBS 113979 TaxID=1176131 RepID=A0A6G1GKV9_9PEZI|nr:hypothetical protein K402DRAFT_425344 [Aulographum hederae CBS 113979]
MAPCYLLKLPVELHAWIISYIDRPSDLKNLCLVSGLSYSAYKELYRDVELNIWNLKQIKLLSESSALTGRRNPGLREVKRIVVSKDKPATTYLLWYRYEDCQAEYRQQTSDARKWIEKLIEQLPPNSLKGFNFATSDLGVGGLYSDLVATQGKLQELGQISSYGVETSPNDQTHNPFSSPSLAANPISYTLKPLSTLEWLETGDLLFSHSPIPSRTLDRIRNISITTSPVNIYKRGAVQQRNNNTPAEADRRANHLLNTKAPKHALRRLCLNGAFVDRDLDIASILVFVDLPQLECLQIRILELPRNAFPPLRDVFSSSAAASPKLTHLEVCEPGYLPSSVVVHINDFLLSFKGLKVILLSFRHVPEDLSLSGIANHGATLETLVIDDHRARGEPPSFLKHSELEAICNASHKLKHLGISLPGNDILLSRLPTLTRLFKKSLDCIFNLHELRTLHILKRPRHFELNVLDHASASYATWTDLMLYTAGVIYTELTKPGRCNKLDLLVMGKHDDYIGWNVQPTRKEQLWQERFYYVEEDGDESRAGDEPERSRDGVAVDLKPVSRAHVWYERPGSRTLLGFDYAETAFMGQGAVGAVKWREEYYG